MTKNQLLKTALLALSVALAGCTANETKSNTSGAEAKPMATPSNPSYDKAYKAAVAAVDKAKSVGGEWRDVRWKKSKTALIPAAEKAAKKGDFGKAIELLEMAKAHGELGYAQAMAQKNAGPRF